MNNTPSLDTVRFRLGVSGVTDLLARTFDLAGFVLCSTESSTVFVPGLQDVTSGSVFREHQYDTVLVDSCIKPLWESSKIASVPRGSGSGSTTPSRVLNDLYKQGGVTPSRSVVEVPRQHIQ